ncbi:hypothetical protein ACFWFF_23785 [Streptomyces sp. NPDC060223]|uniref:hypothetical protein n=1 Tax=unclassified Streptomyces TaxID=2593676 RepID=UPI00362B9702
MSEELARGYGEAYVTTTSREYLKGFLSCRRLDVLFLLEGRGFVLSGADRERIATCNDLGDLTRWFNRATTTATSAAEVFTEDPADRQQ